MHETLATATFALSMPHTIWKGLLFSVFYSMCGLRCAPDSSHSDIPTDPLSSGLEMLLWLESEAHLRMDMHETQTPVTFPCDHQTSPDLPWLLRLHFCALFSPLPRRSGRSPPDPPRQPCPPGVWNHFCVILTPRASVSTGGQICGFSSTMYFSCFLATSALNMRETRK